MVFASKVYMSASTDSNISTIYVHLIGEGTLVIRPTKGALLGGDVYQVLPTPDYDPDVEHWQFPPGCIVRCKQEKWDGDEVLVAHEEVKSPLI